MLRSVADIWWKSFQDGVLSEGRIFLPALEYGPNQRMPDLSASIDAARLACGFLTLSQMMEALDGNHVLDPFSTLISAGVSVGKNNVFYPGVTLKTCAGSEIRLADGNIVHSGSHFEAVTGNIEIGSNNQFGEGGFSAKANRTGAEIRIGSHGRFLNNPAIYGTCTLGDGSQILGNITVDSCTLSDGSSFQEDDPDLRGGLLKGNGVARNLNVARGMVIAGNGTFSSEDLLPQKHFHPKP
ncbi:hypothetical protein LAB1_29510 [Roseibium sp. LAB1]